MKKFLLAVTCLFVSHNCFGNVVQLTQQELAAHLTRKAEDWCAFTKFSAIFTGFGTGFCANITKKETTMQVIKSNGIAALIAGCVGYICFSEFEAACKRSHSIHLYSPGSQTHWVGQGMLPHDILLGHPIYSASYYNVNLFLGYVLGCLAAHGIHACIDWYKGEQKIEEPAPVEEEIDNVLQQEIIAQ